MCKVFATFVHCRYVGIKIASSSPTEDADGSQSQETRVEIDQSVRGKDVFIIQTGGGPSVNDTIMELLIMAYACRTSCAARVIAVIPYMPYSRQNRMQKRGCIVAKLMANMLAKAGISQIITMDLHHKEIHGFFDMTLDNLRASPCLLSYIKEHITDYQNAVIVANGPAAVQRASSYAQRLKLRLAVIYGNRKDEELDGRTSPPPEATGVSPMRSRTALSMSTSISNHLVGDVSGRIAIIADNLIDEVDSIIAAADFLKDRGAYKVYAVATHGILSKDSPEQLERSAIEEVIVANTLPTYGQAQRCHKIKTIDISPILGEAIRRIHNGESMSALFANIPGED